MVSCEPPNSVWKALSAQIPAHYSPLEKTPHKTAVIGNGTIAAARTLVAVTAQNGSAARCDGLQDLAVRPMNPAAMILDEAITLCANDIGHL